MTREDTGMIYKKLNYHEGILEYRQKELAMAQDEVGRILAQNHILNERDIIASLKRQLGIT